MDNYQIHQLFWVLRIIVAGICGSVIGFERTNRSKSAGIRTHCIVALGSALMMVISKYGFADTVSGELGMRGADGARIAAQVVSGIGFLGAGMIFVHKNSITGLTTAAGIWATSGIGMAIGAGMYVMGFLATVAIVATQLFFHKNFRWLKSPMQKKIYIDFVTEEDYQKNIVQKLENLGITILDASAEKNVEAGTRNYRLTVEMPDLLKEDDILDMVDYNCRIKNIL